MVHASGVFSIQGGRKETTIRAILTYAVGCDASRSSSDAFPPVIAPPVIPSGGQRPESRDPALPNASVLQREMLRIRSA
jgi:hypothetical protein